MKASAKDTLDTAPPTPKKRRRFLKKRWLLLAAVALGIYSVVRVVSAPVQGHVTHDKLSVTSAHAAKTAPTLPPTTLTNDYYDLHLPRGYQTQQNSPAVPGLLSQQTFIKPAAFGSMVVSVAVKTLPEGGVSGDSSYQLRRSQTSRFSLSSQLLRGDSVTTTNDSQSAAVTAFWPHGGYLATISVSQGIDNPSDDGNKDELTVLKTVLDAWSWR